MTLWITGLLLALGGLGCVVSGIGLHRFPDFYSRMHAAGVGDTLGMGGILAGLVLWQLFGTGGAWDALGAQGFVAGAGGGLVAFKLLTIGFFLAMTGPVSSHALARAAWFSGLEPELGQEGAPSPK